MNATQRKAVKRDDLRAIVDEQIADANNITTIRGIIRDEITTKINEMLKTFENKYIKKIDDLGEQNVTIINEQNMIKKALVEQQKFLERLRGENTENNIFISGIPNKMDINGIEITDCTAIIKHILTYVRILKIFESREGMSRHSAKIIVNENSVKRNIFEGCKKLKDFPDGNPMKKVFLKNEETPLQRKENDRLYQKNESFTRRRRPGHTN